ncbi:hypothetical protein TWF569_001142 [Orbilia oligospora]|uniref:Uncharacterized protein n=1 Tax=Orbilia oligospora TaxID=2813651 RepID=A0A7C8NHY8_ORBOL|nr:hypothetical protein TWF102_004342 [Orbilia oligospora]KAF3124853.1 hypothetical protein TWF569_001142 [Orbilia oligospora]KAF3130162.1 hypothetical protein TWF703_008328 [Orbilia oligospora]
MIAQEQSLSYYSASDRKDCTIVGLPINVSIGKLISTSVVLELATAYHQPERRLIWLRVPHIMDGHHCNRLGCPEICILMILFGLTFGFEP